MTGINEEVTAARKERRARAFRETRGPSDGRRSGRPYVQVKKGPKMGNRGSKKKNCRGERDVKGKKRGPLLEGNQGTSGLSLGLNRSRVRSSGVSHNVHEKKGEP